jgi:hypothetical protein
MKLQLLDSQRSTITNNGKKCAPWNIVFIRSLISLHQKIWTDRNTHVHVHGTSIKEHQQKLRQRVLEKIKSIYNENCQLAPRYQAINTIPIENRQRQTTQRLQEWIAKIEHQKSMTLFLNENKFTQLTIQEAFRRVRKGKEHTSKYPPYSIG